MAGIRSWLKDWLPPAAIRLARRLLLDAGRQYATYEVAAQACASNNYESADLVTSVVAKTQAYRGLLAHQPATVDLLDLRPLLAVALARSAGPLRVIDFGGGAGAHHAAVSAALRGIRELDWCVVETAAMAMAKAAGPVAAPALRFFSSLDDAVSHLDRVDILFVSSVLQYMPRPVETLRQLANAGADVMYLARTPMGEGLSEPIVMIQQSLLSDNGPGPKAPQVADRVVNYPITLVDRQLIEGELSKDYDVVVRVVEPSALDVGGRSWKMWGYLCKKKQD